MSNLKEGGWAVYGGMDAKVLATLPHNRVRISFFHPGLKENIVVTVPVDEVTLPDKYVKALESKSD
jgi:hypothetical protein